MVAITARERCSESRSAVMRRRSASTAAYSVESRTAAVSRSASSPAALCCDV
jgi:hypothetical protein